MAGGVGFGGRGWDAGLGCKGRFSWVDLKKNFALSEDPTLFNKGNAWHGAPVHTKNQNDRDSKPQHSKFFCSEIVWQTYLLSCARLRINPGLLRSVQDHIANEETRMVIWQAARAADKHRITQKPTRKPTWCPDVTFVIRSQGRNWVSLCGESDCIRHDGGGRDACLEEGTNNYDRPIIPLRG